MESTIAVLATVGALALWRLRLRRHPNWAASDDARFYTSSGSWMVIFTLYWFMQSRLDPHLVWKVWPILALVSMFMLMRGIDALNDRLHTEDFVPSVDDRDARMAGAGVPGPALFSQLSRRH